MTDPTITIAGLRAQIDSLYEMLKTANDGRAEKSSAAAWDYAARMRVESERDALAAQLAEARAELAAAPKVCAIHSYEHGPGPCLTCGAWPPGTRELIAACRTRIAGLEQAANERSRTGQMIEPERSEWIVAAVAVADALGGGLGPVAGTSGTIDPREWIHFAAGLADRAKKLTARVAELEARPVLTVERLTDAARAAGWAAPVDADTPIMSKAIMRNIGPVTLPLPAQDRAEELCRAYHERAADMDGHMVGRWQYHGPESQAICTEAMRRALTSLGAPPTSPPDARPVFAGVSVEELARVFWCATGRGYKPEQWETLAPSTQAEWIKGIRAVLDRLEVSLVAPVDPEEVARDFYIRLSKLTGSLQLSAHTDGDRRDRIETMRATLTAAGIPVTPEVDK